MRPWSPTHSIVYRARERVYNTRVMLQGTISDGWACTRDALLSEWRVRDGEWHWLGDPQVPAAAVSVLRVAPIL